MTAASMIDALRRQVGGARDGALLRFTLGNALRDAGQLDAAITELRAAVGFDPLYAAAWKQLGSACLAAGQHAAAADAWCRGIAAARLRGNCQARKEMTVFLRRLDRSLAQTVVARPRPACPALPGGGPGQS